MTNHKYAINKMLYLVINDHSGILLNVYRCLNKHHYSIDKNEYGKTAGNGSAYIKLYLSDGELPLPPSIESELLNIEGCTDILYEQPNSESSDEKTKRIESEQKGLKLEVEQTVNKILEDFESIESIVFSFAQRHQNEHGSNDNYRLGFELGKTIYLEDYAYGKPLKLELALKRMLSEALKPFGNISCTNQIVSIEENRLCNHANEHSHCDFSKGFMTGFLHQSPLTKNTRVENISCRSSGQASCSFEFH
jgi:predicted hydrocarbon binding protein